MKKKFVLTLALVLMVAASLMAATPLEVSGSFKAGYDFTFAGGSTIDAANDYKATINASVAGDFWKVTIANNEALRFGEKKDSFYNMKAEIYLTKALAEQGMDMGDLGLTLHVGTGVGKDALTVLANKADFRKDKQLQMASAKNFGVTVDYGTLLKGYVSVDPTVAALPMVASVKFMPVDGIEAAVGFSNNFTETKTPITNAKGLAVSAKADVAKLVELDFALAATAEFLMDLDASKNTITADVAGEYEGIGLWVAYQKDYANVNKLAAKASYATKVEDFDLSASFQAKMNDLAKVADKTKTEYTIAAGATYAMGGATYALDAEYTVNAASFTLTPSVSISF
ncbi:MAG: hypothetical protein EOM45_14640 [Clostridia bacterium]|nr:hypothetical protein [Clostridia bacterium]